MTLPRKRWLVGAAAAVAALLALIPLGRWEARRHARIELAGIRGVLKEIGPIDQPALDAYRVDVGPGLDCLLYRRGTNPFALEFCFDGAGRVVEAINRLGSGPRIWSIREDPSASDIKIDRQRTLALIARVQAQAR